MSRHKKREQKARANLARLDRYASALATIGEAEKAYAVSELILNLRAQSRKAVVS